MFLEGVRVVEMGVWVAGPAAAGVMADWGADVVKIEPPAGDPMRRAFQNLAGIDLPSSPPFNLDNRGKRSVVLDLRSQEGLRLAKRLIASADGQEKQRHHTSILTGRHRAGRVQKLLECRGGAFGDRTTVVPDQKQRRPAPLDRQRVPVVRPQHLEGGRQAVCHDTQLGDNADRRQLMCDRPPGSRVDRV